MHTDDIYVLTLEPKLYVYAHRLEVPMYKIANVTSGKYACFSGEDRPTSVKIEIVEILISVGINFSSLLKPNSLYKLRCQKYHLLYFTKRSSFSRV